MSCSTTTVCAENKQEKGLSVFERYLTLWVAFCIAGGIVLGKAAPGVATYLDSLSLHVGGSAGGLYTDRRVSLLHDVSHYGKN